MRIVVAAMVATATAAWAEKPLTGEAPNEQAPNEERPTEAKPTPKTRDVAEVSLDDLLATPIAVSSMAGARPQRETPGVVTALNREEIFASGARDLKEVLELIPGFQFGTDGQGVIGSGFRGVWGNQGKVLVMIDSIEITELLYTTNQFGNEVPAQIIERVEVIRGPGSAIYGGNAEMAVINVITRGAKDLMGAEIGGRYTQGYRGLVDRSIGLSGGWAFDSGLELAFNVAVGQGQAGQGYYTDFHGITYDMAGNSGLDPLVVNLSAQWKGLTFRFLYDDYRMMTQDGAGDTLPAPVAQRFRTVGADLRYRLSVWDRVVPTAYLQWRLQNPWEVTDKSNPLFYTKDATRLKGGVMVEVTPLDGLELLAGLETYGDFAWLNDTEVVGFQTQFFKGNDSQGQPILENTASYANVAGYAQASWDNSWVNVSVGGRLEWNSRFGVNFAPRLALSKRIDRFHVKALYSGAFRSPGFENISLNPNIAAEKTQTAEVETGLQVSDIFYAGVNAFYLRVQNPIVYGVDLATNQESYINAGPIASAGWELEAQLRGRFGFLRGTYSLAMPVGNEVSEQFQVPGHTDRTLGFSTHKVTLSGMWRIWRGLRLGGRAVFLSDRYAYLTPGPLDADGNPTGELGLLRSTVNANLWVGYENLYFNGLSLSAGVDNLFNEPVSYPLPYTGGHPPLWGTARAVFVRLSYAWRAER
jgi:outer membrane receptor protein involved in Fe transport